MIIPNDFGHPYRLNKFVEYQHNAAPVDPTFLLAYAKIEKLTPAQCMALCVLHSSVYSEITTLLMFESYEMGDSRKKFWKANKEKLVFNSARRYAKSMDWWPTIIDNTFRTGWIQGLFGASIHSDAYGKLRSHIETLPFSGPFASEVFMAPYVWMAYDKLVPPVKEPPAPPWRKAANETSGLLNILYADEQADNFDSSGVLGLGLPEELNATMQRVENAIYKRYPGQRRIVSTYQRKLCSWRNLFKGKRYAGYHHDRQLAALLHYEEVYPEKAKLWKLVRKIRREIYAPQMLGELGGWTGIRKDRNKLWLTTGLTGAEDIQ